MLEYMAEVSAWLDDSIRAFHLDYVSLTEEIKVPESSCLCRAGLDRNGEPFISRVEHCPVHKSEPVNTAELDHWPGIRAHEIRESWNKGDLYRIFKK